LIAADSSSPKATFRVAEQADETDTEEGNSGWFGGFDGKHATPGISEDFQGSLQCTTIQVGDEGLEPPTSTV
jgi:hypothetical protein